MADATLFLNAGGGIEQVAAVLNEINQQMRTPIPQTVQNLSDLISYGNQLKNSGQVGIEDWFNALHYVISRTISDVRPYRAQDLGIIRETSEWGMLLRKLYVAPMTTQDNESWSVEDGKTYSPYVVHKLVAAEKVFSGFDTWEINPTIPDIQLFPAFENADAAAAFLSAERQAVVTSREMYVEALERMVMANFIGEKLANATKVNGVHYINLLTEYNTKFGKTLTAEQAATDSGAIQYASSQLARWIKNIRNIGTFFNFEGYYRHTPEDRLRVTLLGYFADLAPFYLYANTFHDTFVTLPKYSEVPYWQSQGAAWDFKTLSSINLTTSAGTQVSCSYIIGMLSDIDAMFMTINKPTTNALYNPRIEVTHEWWKSVVGYANNFAENAIVFTFADPVVTDPSTPDPEAAIAPAEKQLTANGLKPTASATKKVTATK